MSIELVIVDIVSGPPPWFLQRLWGLRGTCGHNGPRQITTEGDLEVDEAEAIWDEALWARRNSVSLLVCFCSEPIDI